MSNVYEKCPILENNNYMIRLISKEDTKDLLKVYSDKNALPFFNSDGCNGHNFYCTKENDMYNAINIWRTEYDKKSFVRFSIIDKRKNNVIGSIELFNRISDDFFNGCGLMRLDVRSDYECREALSEIMSIIINPSYELFQCTTIATKAAIYAVERIEALKDIGFERTKEYLIGYDGTLYGDYWVIKNSIDNMS